MAPITRSVPVPCSDGEALGDRALAETVRELRSAGRSPKQIARTLGLRPSVVVPLVRAAARDEAATRAGDVEPDLAGCWVNAGWDEGLIVEGRPEWPRGGDRPACAGLASLMVARDHPSGRVSVAVFLVDTQCLGVKGTIGPRLMSRSELRRLREAVYQPYGGDHVEAPLDLARHLVFGAVDFARSLGFQPHWELALCAGHLGEWHEPCAIRFGCNGKPLYVAGPYDDVSRVLETLDRSVGPDGYDFVLGMDVEGVSG